MDKSKKDVILQQGLDRIESYRKVIESIQSGVSEAESCRVYNVNLSKFRRWCRDNYNQENEVDESFMLYDDFFDWRDALIYAVTSDKSIVATSNFDEAWTYVKTTLSEREAKILEYRFEESMTLEEVANVLGRTRDCVRKIELKALRKLRHPRRAKILLYGLEYINALEEFKKATEESRQEKFNSLISSEELRNKFNSVALELEFDNDSVREMIVQESLKRAVSINFKNFVLEDLNLSVRTYNSLRRAGIKDIKGILDYSDKNGLANIRSFGRISFEELQKKLREFGCYKGLIYNKEE